MSNDVFFSRELKPVGGSDNSSQLIGSLLDRSCDRGREFVVIAELLTKRDHLSLALLNIYDNLPALRCVGCQLQIRVDQVRASNPALLMFPLNALADSKIVELLRRYQRSLYVKAEAKSGICAQ